METDFDFIVIGSGFGGAVSALRLAEKGYTVAVVEKGRRWTALDFPKSSWNLPRYLWLPRIGFRGILGLKLMRHVFALHGVGFGGGSLVYGNTLIEPKASFFDSDPVALRLGGMGLLSYYRTVQQMLGVVPNPKLFPEDQLMKTVAQELGRAETFSPSPVAICFSAEPSTDPYFGGEGPPRSPCQFCGGCFVGCRFGAKNTLDLNYLWLAEMRGVRMITEAEVLDVLSTGDPSGYEIRFRSRGRRKIRVLKARNVVIAAGVLGTLSLLLRLKSEGKLPRLSDLLGRSVKTNGESIVGVYDGSTRADRPDRSQGIAASSSVYPDAHTQVQADRYPAGSDSLATLATVLSQPRFPGEARWRAWLRAVIRNPGQWFRLLNPIGFAKRAMVLIVMQDHDSGVRLRWAGRRLASEKDASLPLPPDYLPEANAFAKRLAAAMGPEAIPFASITESLVGIPVTAHVMGGCPMGDSRESGVVGFDHQIHGYPGLFVCDGSVITSNLGVNPALTIAAFTERAMSLIPDKKNRA